MTSAAALRDGMARVRRAPIVLAGTYAMTVIVVLPLFMLMRGSIEAHLGHSLAAEEAARAVNYQWLSEYRNGAGELAGTLGTRVIGFAAVLDDLSTLLDGGGRPAPIVWVGGAYLLLWLFVSGGILDRLARNRATRSYGFFTACGVYFVRFLRLAPFIALTYYVLFALIHPILFRDIYGALTRDVTAERTAFFYRAALYVVFGVMLVGANTVFDYAKVRAVVEDRRSMLGALSASVRFIGRNLGAIVSLYLKTGVLFVALLFLYALVAPGAGGTTLRISAGLVVSQLYLLARVWVRLVFMASETALFQGRLAHAGYVARPPAVPAEPPIVEQVAG